MTPQVVGVKLDNACEALKLVLSTEEALGVVIVIIPPSLDSDAIFLRCIPFHRY